MFRFFRQIRKSLFASSNTRKYLLYALGEILLVVMGILIALQIDNWNENRKLQARQTQLLTDLRADLEETLEELKQGKEFNALTLARYRTLMQAIDTDAPHSAEIDEASSFLPLFHVPRFSRTTYESIKSQGLDLITNDSLKRQVTELYENDFTYLKEDQARMEWSIHTTTKPIFINRYLRWQDRQQPMVYPVDFEDMKADDGFVNFLSELIVVRAAGIRFYEQTISSIRAVLAAIDNELKKLRK
ncbi:MAG: DUF6090 family protein [Robiginitalea sp.]